ncbi:MAG: hypothetical protein LBS44_00270 [Deltaproteobacteria bacterium]|nr:hypothetical protein [Deltaproteobacteria bacterium]
MRPANPIYSQAMARFISSDLQNLFPALPQDVWIEDNRLLVGKLLEEFVSLCSINWTSFPLHLKNNLAIKFDESTHAFMLFAFILRSSRTRSVRWEMQYAEGRRSVGIYGIDNGAKYLIEIKV